MKLIFAWVLVLVTFVGVGGCKRTYESGYKDSISYMKKMVTILQSVKDEASAKAAAPKIEAIVKDMKALKEEMDKLKKPSKEVEEQVDKKYKSETDKIGVDFLKEIARISADPKLKGPLDKAMSEFRGL